MRFYSDNTASVCPEIMAALTAANAGLERAYGADAWSTRLDDVFSEYFGAPVRAFAVMTGTAANSLALATLSPPYGSVLAHDEAHIVRDECGAPEFFGAGLRVATLEGRGAKLDPATVTRYLDARPTSVHTVQPSVISITQATELGRVYDAAEVSALSRLAHDRGLALHMDGARFANAVVHLNCEPADVTWRAGVDVLSFGATKNGAMGAEAVIFFRSELVRDFEFRRKRAGHLLSKMRYVSTQLVSYVESGAWRRNAQRANGFAARVGAAAADRLLEPIEANEVFLKLGEKTKAALRERGFEFYDWGATLSGEARFVTSWDQDESAVDALVHALRELSPS